MGLHFSARRTRRARRARRAREATLAEATNLSDPYLGEVDPLGLEVIQYTSRVDIYARVATYSMLNAMSLRSR